MSGTLLCACFENKSEVGAGREEHSVIYDIKSGVGFVI